MPDAVVRVGVAAVGEAMGVVDVVDRRVAPGRAAALIPQQDEAPDLAAEQSSSRIDRCQLARPVIGVQTADPSRGAADLGRGRLRRARRRRSLGSLQRCRRGADAEGEIAGDASGQRVAVDPCCPLLAAEEGQVGHEQLDLDGDVVRALEPAGPSGEGVGHDLALGTRVAGRLGGLRRLCQCLEDRDAVLHREGRAEDRHAVDRRLERDAPIGDRSLVTSHGRVSVELLCSSTGQVTGPPCGDIGKHLLEVRIDAIPVSVIQDQHVLGHLPGGEFADLSGLQQCGGPGQRPEHQPVQGDLVGGLLGADAAGERDLIGDPAAALAPWDPEALLLQDLRRPEGVLGTRLDRGESALHPLRR